MMLVALRKMSGYEQNQVIPIRILNSNNTVARYMATPLTESTNNKDLCSDFCDGVRKPVKFIE
jgi:hypothetical protein